MLPCFQSLLEKAESAGRIASRNSIVVRSVTSVLSRSRVRPVRECSVAGHDEVCHLCIGSLVRYDGICVQARKVVRYYIFLLKKLVVEGNLVSRVLP